MTELEARELLEAYLKKHLQSGYAVYIGKVYHASELGFSFEAGTYSVSEGKPASFPIYAVDAGRKHVELDLIQHRELF